MAQAIRAVAGAASDLTLVEALEQAAVVVDFTSPDGTRHFAKECAARGIALVVGTTGLDADGDRALTTAASKIAIVQSANMSLGVNLLARLVAEATRALGDRYDVELVELHHRAKKDAPSGTALLLANAVAHARGVVLEEYRRDGRKGVSPREPGDIGLHALRGGDVVGDHTVHFLGPGERIELVHRASSRETFAHGALEAARWLASRAPGRYDMRHVLGLPE